VWEEEEEKVEYNENCNCHCSDKKASKLLANIAIEV